MSEPGKNVVDGTLEGLDGSDADVIPADDPHHLGMSADKLVLARSIASSADLVRVASSLLERVARLEDQVRESREEVKKTNQLVTALLLTAAKKKQRKKLLKLLEPVQGGELGDLLKETALDDLDEAEAAERSG